LSNPQSDSGTDGRSDTQKTDLCSYFLQNIDGKSKLVDKLLYELAEQDGLLDIIGPTITAIGEKVACLKFNENYQPAIDVIFNSAHH
jgi:hypothetical protein